MLFVALKNIYESLVGLVPEKCSTFFAQVFFPLMMPFAKKFLSLEKI